MGFKFLIFILGRNSDIVQQEILVEKQLQIMVLVIYF